MLNLERTVAFLKSLETRDGSTLTYYAPDVVQREFPNQLVKEGATRDLEAMTRGAEAGKKSVRDERYEIVRMIEQGDEIALEVIWTARLNVPLGKLAAGDIMRAHLGMFLTWRDGKIVSQRNYDCFDPF
jgi:ketosteroid isomerase-like protein